MKERCPLRMFWYFTTMGGVAGNLITLNYLHCPAFKENTDNFRWTSALKTVRPSQCSRLCWWYVSWYVMWSGMECRLERRKDVQLQVKFEKMKYIPKASGEDTQKTKWESSVGGRKNSHHYLILGWVREAVCAKARQHIRWCDINQSYERFRDNGGRFPMKRPIRFNWVQLQ